MYEFDVRGLKEEDQERILLLVPQIERRYLTHVITRAVFEDVLTHVGEWCHSPIAHKLGVVWFEFIRKQFPGVTASTEIEQLPFSDYHQEYRYIIAEPISVYLDMSFPKTKIREFVAPFVHCRRGAGASEEFYIAWASKINRIVYQEIEYGR